MFYMCASISVTSTTIRLDIDECVSGEDNCDDERGYCNNSEGGFECSCRVGYSGDGTEGNCTGID